VQFGQFIIIRHCCMQSYTITRQTVYVVLCIVSYI
jgi:hypothetical protein